MEQKTLKLFRFEACMPLSMQAEESYPPLSFVSEDELFGVMELLPGAVTPLGILNDTERKAEVFLDRDFLEPPVLIGVHPNENTATVWIKTNDL